MVMWEKRKLTKKVRKIIGNFCAVFIATVFLFPVYWIISMAFKTPVEAFAIPPVWFFKVTFKNFQDAFQYADMYWYFLTSIIVTISSTLISLFVGLFAAYALVRFKFRHNLNKHISFWILSLRMAPPIVAIIPFFLIFRSLKILDTWRGLIIAYLFFNLPLVIWLLMGYIKEIPVEIEEAAMIDGCSTLGILSNIVLPLIAPGVFATMVICAVFCWNELLFALVLMTENLTVPVALVGFISGLTPNWSQMAAALTVYILPMIGVAIFIQRYFVKGLIIGALRG